MTDSYPTRLKAILQAEGRSQTWLGTKLDPPVSRSAVCEWASGSRIPTQDRRAQIARALGRDTTGVFPETTERKAA
jgi:transcriptional regulator with XRE-family HTH domain